MARSSYAEQYTVSHHMTKYVNGTSVELLCTNYYRLLAYLSLSAFMAALASALKCPSSESSSWVDSGSFPPFSSSTATGSVAGATAGLNLNKIVLNYSSLNVSWQVQISKRSKRNFVCVCSSYIV